MFRVSVVFSATTCARCKARRQTAQACPECGRKPDRHEVDFRLLARRKLIDEFRKGRLPGRAGPADPEVVGDQTHAAFETLGVAIRHVAEKSRDASGLTRAFEQIDSLVASWPEDALPRPQRNLGRRISKMLQQFRKAMELFVEALYDQTVDAAQTHAREGQAILDSVGLSSGDEPLEDWHSLGRRALDRAGGGALGLAGLDERLAGDLGLTHPPDYPAGHGLQLYLLDAVVDDLFDRSNVEALRNDFTLALATTQPPDTELFLQPQWRSEALRVGRISTSGWRTITRVLRDDPEDIEIVDSMLSLVESNREAVLRFVLATLLSLNGDPWPVVQARTSGAIIKSADQRFPSLKLGQVDTALRNVSAHKSFDVNNDSVELHLNGGRVERYSAEDFLDRCLHSLEVTAAFQYALLDWVGSLGVEWPSSPLQRAADREDALAFMLGASGFEVESTEISDEVVEVKVVGDRRPWGPLVASLVSLLPDSVRSLSILGLDGAMSPFAVRAELEPIRDFLSRDERDDFDHDSLLLIAALQAIQCDGETQVPSDWWPGILSHAANWREGDTVASQTRRLLAIRPLVAKHGDPSILADLRLLLTAAREGRLRDDDHAQAGPFRRESAPVTPATERCSVSPTQQCQ